MNTPVDIKAAWEMVMLEKEIKSIVNRLLKEYNTTTKEGLTQALRQACWEGICKGKDWS